MWDDCQQLLGVLFTTEERNRILENTRTLVLGPTGAPIVDPLLAVATFPATRPNWDFNMAEVKERLHIYHQVLLAGLKAATHRPERNERTFNSSENIRLLGISKEGPDLQETGDLPQVYTKRRSEMTV